MAIRFFRALRPLTPVPMTTVARMRTRSIPMVHAMSSTPEGQITSELINSMRLKISDALKTDNVQVNDVQGDGRHVEIVVVSKEFEGKTAVNRQRMVYKAIWEELSDAVHAVDAMVTQTPDEAGV